MPVWDPFAELDALRHEIDRTFDAFGPGRRPPSRQTVFLPGRAARQYPLINLSEDEGRVYIEALAPGVDPKTLDLSVLQGTLTIKGEKPGLDQVSAEAYHRNERAAGRFIRSIELPVEVDATRVQADYRNGLLLLTLPKSEKAKPKQITVSVA